MDASFELDALSTTYDPDVEPGTDDPELFSFTWLCRRECESYPVYDDDWNIISQMNKTCPVWNMDVGCFYGDSVNSSGLCDHNGNQLVFSFGGFLLKQMTVVWL